MPDRVSTAYYKFVQIFHTESVGMGLYFWNFLGYDLAPNVRGGSDDNLYGWDLTDEAKNIVDMLNGPYAEPLAKALVIQGRDPYRKAKFNDGSTE